MSWQWKKCKIGRGIDLSFQNWHEDFDEFWPEHLKISKICTFDALPLTKLCNFWVKKVQRSYVWWHWTLIQNLKENWLLLSKMTWGIWEIFTRGLESLKIGILMGFFCLKWKMYELEIYRELIVLTMNNDTKLEEELTCRFKTDMRNLTNFGPKVSKICTLMGSFWSKYIMFELKNYRGVILMALNIDAKFEAKLTWAF